MISSWLLHYLPGFLRRRIAGRSYLLKVIDNTGWIFSERILRHAVGFAVGVWIARYVGPHGYGLLNYANAFVLVFAFITTLGIDGIAVRDIIRNPSGRDETVGTLLLLRVVGGLVLMLVVTGAIALVQPSDPRATALIIIIAVGQLLLATDSIDCWFQANVASRYTVVARLGAFFAITLVRIVLILARAPLIAFAWANLAESAVLTVAMLVAYRRSGQRLAKLRATVARAKALLSDGWPLLLSAGVLAVSQRLDQVMLGQMAGYAEVGAYAVAVRVIEATYILPTVVAMSIFPAMIKLRAQDPARYEVQIQRLYDFLLWLAITIAVPLTLLSSFLVRLLVGNAYAAAAAPLAILSWMPVFMFFGVVRQRWLLAEGALPAALAVEIAGCGLNVLANLMLIPRYGAVGAATAALVGIVGATLVVAPFSNSIRRSLMMLMRGMIAPVRALRRT